MNRKFLLAFVAFSLVSAAGFAQQASAPAAPPPPMQLTSPAFADGSPFPPQFSCLGPPSSPQLVGANAITPPLEWTNAPKGTVSFVLLLHDMEPHPRKGVEDVTHWIAWNIPGTAHSLQQGLGGARELPDGTRQGPNVRNGTGYMGPCAPPGPPHHYAFELFALDTKLDLPPTASRSEVMKAMDGHILADAVLTTNFHR